LKGMAGEQTYLGVLSANGVEKRKKRKGLIQVEHRVVSKYGKKRCNERKKGRERCMKGHQRKEEHQTSVCYEHKFSNVVEGGAFVEGGNHSVRGFRRKGTKKKKRGKEESTPKGFLVGVA